MERPIYLDETLRVIVITVLGATGIIDNMVSIQTFSRPLFPCTEMMHRLQSFKMLVGHFLGRFENPKKRLLCMDLEIHVF